MTATITTADRPCGPARIRTHRPRPVSPRTYARRRAVVGGVSAVVVAIGLVGAFDAVSGVTGTSVQAEVGGVASTRATVVARPGDTLWTIAEKHHGDVRLRAYVDALIDVNDGPAIQAGQRVLLP